MYAAAGLAGRRSEGADDGPCGDHHPPARESSPAPVSFPNGNCETAPILQRTPDPDRDGQRATVLEGDAPARHIFTDGFGSQADVRRE